MTSEKLAQLTEEELIQEEKKQKSSFTAFKILLGLMAVVAVWNAIHKGSSSSSLLPVIFLPLLMNLDKNYKAVKAEIQSRQPQ